MSDVLTFYPAKMTSAWFCLTNYPPMLQWNEKQAMNDLPKLKRRYAA